MKISHLFYNSVVLLGFNLSWGMESIHSTLHVDDESKVLVLLRSELSREAFSSGLL